MRRLLPLTVILAVAAAVLVVSRPGDSAVSMEPPTPAKVYEHDVPGAEPAPSTERPQSATKPAPTGSHLVAELAESTVKRYSMVGVTWDPTSKPADLTVQVRWRHDNSWSRWTDLELDLENTATEGGRPGTEPLWVGTADGVAVQVTSPADQRPAGLKVATIDPGTSSTITPAAYDTSAQTVPVADLASAVGVAQPAIIPRSAWGASNTGTCDSPVYGATTRGAVIHHTAGSNSYTKSQSASIVKATQAYHTGSRNWCDIGYNFLVDKYGQIFEGRKGGIDKPVRAAHSGNDMVNQETMGVSMMGTFSTTQPSAAMKESVADLVAWRFDRYGIAATGTYNLGGKTLNRIAGHRNVVGTECPGNAAYAWLSAEGGLRDAVADRLAGAAQYPYAIPSDLAATAQASSLALDWADVSGAQLYRVQLSTSPTMSGATYYRFTASQGEIADLSPGTRYYVRVAVIDPDSGAKLSDYTAQPYPSAVTFDLPVPAGLRSTAQTASSLSLDWDDVAGASKYRVQLSTKSSMSGATYHEVTASAAHLMGLQAGTTYWFRVAAIDPVTGAKASDYTQTPYPSVKTPAKQAGGFDLPIPTGLKSTAQTGSALSLDWNDVAGAERYRVQLSTKSSMSGATYHEVTASAAHLTDLQAGTTYWFRVAAIDPVTGAKASDYTQTPYPSAFTTVPGDFEAPIPTGLRSTAQTASSLSLDWDDVPGAPMYRVQLSTSSSMSGATYHVFTPSKGDVTGLRGGTKYYFRVAVIDPGSGAKLSDYTQTPYPSTSLTGSTARDSVNAGSSVTFKGHGYGHGNGMGQYGAEGGARDGKSYAQILAHYYPGTALSSKSGSIRVLITDDTSDSVMIEAASGVKFRRVSGGSTLTLPAKIGGKSVIRWSIDPYSGDTRKSALRYRTSSTWHVYDNMTWTGDAQFEGSRLEVVMPSGLSNRYYRTAVRSAVPSSGARHRDTLNVLSIEDYTRGVVAREMPSSWHPEALKAQSVAARTYGVRALTSSRYYDICDTTSCQVYGGVAAETSASDAAVSGTAGKILTYQGSPAFTQFSSSSGGYTNAGSQPYLKAVADPWDDWTGNKNHDWTLTVKASTIEKKYPTIGTLKSLQVLARNGHGDMGGRVTSIKVVGSKGSKTIKGTEARFGFGLRSDWFGF